MRHSAVSSSMMVTCRGPTSRHCFVPLKKRGFRGHFSVHQAATTIMSTASIQNSLVWLTILLRKILPKKATLEQVAGVFITMSCMTTAALFKEKPRSVILVVTKTLDMHQPYPYYGITYENMPESVRTQGTVTVCGMYWVDQTVSISLRKRKRKDSWMIGPFL